MKRVLLSIILVLCANIFCGCSKDSIALFPARENGKCGYINKEGKFVINPKFNYAWSFSEGLARVRIGDEETGKYGYINKEGQFVIKPQFYYAGYFSEGLAEVSIDGEKYGYINKEGQFVIKPQFDYAGSFSEGLAKVRVGEKWGYLH